MNNKKKTRTKDQSCRLREPAHNAVVDGITIVLVLFMFAIMIIIGRFMSNELQADFNSTEDMSSYSINLTKENADIYTPLFDNIFLLIMALLIMFVVISVFMIDTHPVFFWISILLLIFVLVVSALLANVYDDLLIDDPDLAVFAGQFRFIEFIMTHLLGISIGIVFLVLIALYAKLRG